MRLLFLLTFFVSQLTFAQNDEADVEDFDYQIFQYLMKNVEDNKIDQSGYLKFTMPFSKWDSRPVDVSEARIMGEVQQSSIITNFFWGSFSNYYGLTVEEAMALPNRYLSIAISKESDAFKFAREHEVDIEELIKRVQDSPHDVILSHSGLKRVDNVYFEDGVFWRYSIPEDSPFPMSNSIDPISNYEYSKSAKAILDQMSALSLYAVFKKDGIIYLLQDGLLDNSYGYVFTSGEIKKASNHLFKIMHSKKVRGDLYYYVAN